MKIAILGFGPSGSVAGTLLARMGCDVVVLDEDDRPPLLVGESLVPGMIPVLRRLGIEERVAQIGVRKPGVTFYPRPEVRVAFSFQTLPAHHPQYAYNVPRPAFDQILQQRALESGMRHLKIRAEVRAENDRLLLSDDTLARIEHWRGKQPDLVIDASGRRRLSARTLSIPADLGPRRDVSHFAHFHGVRRESPEGQVAIHYLEHGWAWRIPLRDTVSFGIVLPQQAAARLGSSPEERLARTLEQNPQLWDEDAEPRMISAVQTYANYQLISQKGVGSNWAAIGDAFGFVDPMLSPGMMVALQSATLLAEELAGAGSRRTQLDRYSVRMTRMLRAWMELIAYFYSGRIFEMHQTGKEMQNRYPRLPLHILEKIMNATMAGMASGFTTESPFPRNVLRSVDRFLVGAPEKAGLFAVA
jgi:flavin-dependent dehydrogenase